MNSFLGFAFGFIPVSDTNASSEITGSGTVNTVAKFTAGQVIGNSTITDTGPTGLVTIANNVSIPQPIATSGMPTGFLWTGGAHTTLAASTEATDVNFNLKRTVNFATGNITNQRAFLVQAPVYTFVGASTITNAATLAIENAPTGSTNATISNAYALWVMGGTSRFQGDVIITTQTVGDNSTKAASTAFVTTAIANAVAGVNPAVAVTAATTAASDTSTWTYNNGAAGVGATFTGPVNTAITIDGFTYTAITTQSLLVKNDTQSPSGAFNGIYVLTALQTGITGAVFTRRLDYNQPSDINSTGAIPIVNGTDITGNKNTSWLLTSNVTTVGTDPLTYVQFSYSPTNARTPVFVRETMGDADKTFSAGKTQVEQTTAITAPRLLTFPLANSLAAGSAIFYDDRIQTITAVNTITATAAGSDLINGLSTYVIGQTGASVFFITDGVSNWTGGVMAVGSALIGATLKLTAGDINTTSNVAGNMAGMSFPLAINSRYKINGVFNIGCNNTGGVKFAMTLPASATVNVWLSGRGANATSPVFSPIQASATLNATAFCTVNGGAGLTMDGEIATGATPGTFQMQYASGTNTQTSTILQLGTWIYIEKIA